MGPLAKNIDRFLVPGVIAVAVRDLNEWQHATDLQTQLEERVLRQVVGVLDVAAVDSLRATIGAQTYQACRVGDETVVVAIVTGHPIAKSLQRMIRNLAKPPGKRRSKVHTERE